MGISRKGRVVAFFGSSLIAITMLLGMTAYMLTQPLFSVPRYETGGIPTVSADLLREDVRKLASLDRTSSGGIRETVFTLTGYLESMGIMAQSGKEDQAASYRIQGFSYKDVSQSNLIVRFKGADEGKNHGKREAMVIGGHYDAFGKMPGADDNASAVAGLLEICRALKGFPLEGRDIEIVFFSSEEPPYFFTKGMGSYRYVETLLHDHEKVRMAIILEMIGTYSEKPDSQKYTSFILEDLYPSEGNFIALVSSFDWIAETRRMKSIFSSSIGKTGLLGVRSLNSSSSYAEIYFSDNLPFLMAGIPSVMVTDTGFYRNSHYHTKEDTYEKLDYTKMKQVVDATLLTAIRY